MMLIISETVRDRHSFNQNTMKYTRPTQQCHF